LAEAAPAYGVSIDTLRRRMRRGELEARREVVPQGFRWLVPLPDAPQSVRDAPERADRGAHGSALMAAHDRDTAALIEVLRQELATRNQEIARLHDIIAAQAQAIERTAAPATAVASGQPASIERGAPPISSGPDNPGRQGVLDRLRRWLRG